MNRQAWGIVYVGALVASALYVGFVLDGWPILAVLGLVDLLLLLILTRTEEAA